LKSGKQFSVSQWREDLTTGAYQLDLNPDVVRRAEAIGAFDIGYNNNFLDKSGRTVILDCAGFAMRTSLEELENTYNNKTASKDEKDLRNFATFKNKEDIKKGFEEIKEPSGEKRNEIKGTWAEKDGKKIFTPSL
jgi:SpoVK/Ycf46/Vps4 family AAA+-type ATPase